MRASSTQALLHCLSAAVLGLALGAMPAAAQIQGRFPVIGYFPSWGGSAANLQYDKLTHIMYSFVNVSANGAVTQPNDARIKELVTLGHAKGTKIGVAVGGWSAGTTNFSAMAADPVARAAFVKNLVDMCDKYNLDGIDMDWEYPSSSSAVNFKTMMKELNDALKVKGRFLSTAVIAAGNGTGQHIHKEVFDYIDYLNIMSYDGGGQNHSSWELAVQSFDYWVTQRQCPKAKAILGVPFYGKNPATAFKNLLSQDPQAATKDNVGGIYYNGIPTLQRKTELAWQRGGGIMIWEISQDATGANSLLSGIHAKASGYTSSLPPVLAAGGGRLRVMADAGGIRYAGAASDRYLLSVFGNDGRRVLSRSFSAMASEGTLAWDGGALPSGSYAISIRAGSGESVHASRFLLAP
jgi:chitinase